ncbi:hypothetical protein HYU13_01100 [Candidatus Woesearchaeota archaeon]|nr:hypothetical protein [Candidatus Woesearchaeota archaeon]
MVDMQNPFSQLEDKKAWQKQEQGKIGIPPSMVQETENVFSRIRVLEERYNNLRTEVKLTEDNMVKKNKKLATDLKTLTSDITEVRHEIEEVKERILLLVKELQGFAKKGDIQTLQKYIEMWEPLNFVTHQELEDALNEKLSHLLQIQHPETQ